MILFMIDIPAIIFQTEQNTSRIKEEKKSDWIEEKKIPSKYINNIKRKKPFFIEIQ